MQKLIDLADERGVTFPDTAAQDNALDLLHRLLRYNDTERLQNAAAAMDHAYFADIPHRVEVQRVRLIGCVNFLPNDCRSTAC